MSTPCYGTLLLETLILVLFAAHPTAVRAEAPTGENPIPAVPSPPSPYPQKDVTEVKFVFRDGGRILWKFIGPYTVGQFLTGDFWVLASDDGAGPRVRIKAIAPPSFVQDGRTINGSMVNPPANSNEQGFDSWAYQRKTPSDPTHPGSNFYVEALNKARQNGAPINVTHPLILFPGDSLISVQSVSEPTDRPTLRRAAILTVVDSIPPWGTFRPAYCCSDEPRFFHYDDIRWAKLGNTLDPLAPDGSAPGAMPLSELTDDFEFAWAPDFCRLSNLSDYIHPIQNVPHFYGSNMSTRTGTAALILNIDVSKAPNVSEYSNLAKRDLLIGLLQNGIDGYGLYQAGQIYSGVGGHGVGRKIAIMFMVQLLTDEMPSFHRNRDGTTNLTRFTEDNQYWYVRETSPDIYNYGEPPAPPYDREEFEHPNLGPPDPGVDVSYQPEHKDMPEWSMSYWTKQPADEDGVMPEQIDWGLGAPGPLRYYDYFEARYSSGGGGNHRHCCGISSLPPALLAVSIMDSVDPEAGLKEKWNPATFDYGRRHMHYTKNSDLGSHSWQTPFDITGGDFRSWGPEMYERNIAAFEIAYWNRTPFNLCEFPHGGGSGFNHSHPDIIYTPTLVNDDCENACALYDGDTFFRTQSASTDGPDLSATCDLGPAGDGIVHADTWYRYTATCTGDLTVTVCSEVTYDSRLAVYTDQGNCPPLPEEVIGCNDDDARNPCGLGRSSTVTVAAAAGDSFLIQVGGFEDREVGTGTITVACRTCLPVVDLQCSSSEQNVGLQWTNGTRYKSIQIRRNAAIIVTLPGDAASFDDVNLPAGVYTYDVIGQCPTTESEFATCVVDHTGPPFLRGDADGNGIFNGLLDSLFILEFQFRDGPPPPCLASADADADAVFNGINDALFLLNHQFQGGAPPAPPHPDCGTNPDLRDPLECLLHPGCAQR